MTRTPWILLLLVASACPRGDSASATDAKPSTPAPADAPAKSETKSPTAVAEPAKETRPKASAKDVAAQRKLMLAALNEGRALVKKGEHTAGMAKYREVLAIDGSHTAALAELGWAAFPPPADPEPKPVP